MDEERDGKGRLDVRRKGRKDRARREIEWGRKGEWREKRNRRRYIHKMG